MNSAHPPLFGADAFFEVSENIAIQIPRNCRVACDEIGNSLTIALGEVQSSSMPPKAKPATPDNSADIRALRDEIVELKDHIRVLIDVIDGVREELQWLTRNGLPSTRESSAPVPVVFPSPAEQCDLKAGVRVMADGGGSAPTRVTLAPTAPPREYGRNGPRPELAEFIEGDAVEFMHGGREEFGEIVSIDSGRNAATVMLIPSGTDVEVALDDLVLVPPDEDDDFADETSPTPTLSEQQPATDASTIPPASAAPPGRLFAVPGDQGRLF